MQLRMLHSSPQGWVDGVSRKCSPQVETGYGLLATSVSAISEESGAVFYRLGHEFRGHLPQPLRQRRGVRGVQTGNIGNKTNREPGLHNLSYRRGGLAYALERDLCNGPEGEVNW